MRISQYITNRKARSIQKRITREDKKRANYLRKMRIIGIIEDSKKRR